MDPAHSSVHAGAPRGPDDGKENTVDDELGDRLDHVLRTRLPWRRTNLTECGRDPQQHPAITQTEYAQRLRKHGQRRTAFTVCQTCAGRLWMMRNGEPCPVSLSAILRREIDRGDDTLERELQAIAILVEGHRDEYDELLVGLGDVAHLDTVRKRVRR